MHARAIVRASDSPPLRRPADACQECGKTRQAKAPWSHADGRKRAEALLAKWRQWAIRRKFCPFKELAGTIQAHWEGMLDAIADTLANATGEATDGTVHAARRQSQGFGASKDPILVAVPIAGQLARLPALSINPAIARVERK